MSILVYPIFYYKSKTDYQMNFERDLSTIGIAKDDFIEKQIQEKRCYPNTHFSIIVTKVIRKANNPPPNN